MKVNIWREMLRNNVSVKYEKGNLKGDENGLVQNSFFWCKLLFHISVIKSTKSVCFGAQARLRKAIAPGEATLKKRCLSELFC